MVVKNENGRNQEINRNEIVRDTDVIVGTPPPYPPTLLLLKWEREGRTFQKLRQNLLKIAQAKVSKDSKETCP